MLPFFFAIVFLVGYPNISFKNHYFLLSIFMILVMLPILSIIYVSELHVRDPERVLYPVSMGFFMVMFMVLSVSDKIMDSNMSSENIVVSLIIISSVFIYSFEFREYKNIQYDFLNQLVGIVKERKLPSVMVRDYTGILGDVYTDVYKRQILLLSARWPEKFQWGREVFWGLVARSFLKST